MNNHTIRAAYLNCRGLPAGSFDRIVSFVSGPSPFFDLIFLSETWHLNHDYYPLHPLFLCSTPLPPPAANGRRYGGILCIASLHIIRSCSFSVSSHSIDVTIFGSNIRALYLPPSLSDMEFNSVTSRPISHISSSPLPDILLGDINTLLGSQANGYNAPSSFRTSCIQQLLLSGHYNRILPSSGHAKNHHVLSRLHPDLSWSYLPVDPNVWTSTDHKLMSCKFTPRVLPDLGPIKECFRINLRYLDFAAIRSLCSDYYSVLASEFDQFIVDALSRVEHLASTSSLDSLCLLDRQSLVDHIDSCLSSAILTSAEEACGSYTPSVIRASPDKLFALLPTAPTLPAAIRIFKRACRTKTVTLTSRDPSISPAADAVLHYKSVFTQTDPRFRPPVQSPYRGVSFVSEMDPDVDFTVEALLRFWQKYPTHVSGGEDGIHIRILRALSNTALPDHTIGLFKICCLLGVTPSSWNVSVIHPIPKKDTTTINTFRPISLTLMLRRSFERLFLNHLSRSPASWLHHSQAGFRRGFSTLTHTLVADDCALRGQKYRVFYDFAQAYDTVPVPLLLSKMKTRKASDQVLALVDALFLCTSTKVIVNGSQTESIPLSRGLFQGSLLSPLLFDIFIDDLAHLLNQDTPHSWQIPRALLFADDLTAGSNRVYHLAVASQQLAEWSRENGMVINLAKCGIVGLTDDDPDVVLPGIGPIPRVECYTYLGFPYKSRGVDWVAHLDSVASKAANSLSFCKNRSLLWPAGLRLAFYRTFIRSLMDYGAGIIFHWLMNGLDPPARSLLRVPTSNTSRLRHLLPLQQVQDSALHWILEHRDHTVVAHSMLALPTISVRFSNLACLLTRHFRGMDDKNPARTLRTILFGNVGRVHDRILPQCYNHPDYRPWQSDKRRLQDGLLLPLPGGLTPESTSYPLKLWLRNKFFADCATQSSLCRLFVPQIRRRHTGAVGSIYFKSLRLRKNAIAWHLSNFAIGAICPHCHELFRQSHLTKCRFQDRLLVLSPQHVVTKYLSLPLPADGATALNFINFMLQNRHLAALAPAFGWLEFWIRPRNNYST
jgi:hypothetical protein